MENRNEITGKLQQIFRKTFDENSLEIHEGMGAQDVEEWTSLTHTLMIAEVEKTFGIKFKLKEIIQFEQVSDLLDAIERHIGTGKNGHQDA